MDSSQNTGYNLASLESLYKHYLVSVKNKNRNTVKNYLSDLRSFYWWLKKFYRNSDEDDIREVFNAVNSTIVYEYRQYLVKDMIPIKTINRRLSGIRLFFDFCQEQQWMHINPARSIGNVNLSTTLASEKAVINKSKPEQAEKTPANPMNVERELEHDDYDKQTIIKPKTLYTYIGVILTVLLGIFLANMFFIHFIRATTSIFAYPTLPVKPTRTLLYSGKLSDSLGNPVISKTNVQFRLYSRSQGGRPLYRSGVCTVYPDQTSAITMLIGKDCGKPINSSVFSENPNVYMGVTVGTDLEMVPRKQIPTAGYAYNSETLQGFPLGYTTSSIPFISSAGEILIGSSTPAIRSIGESETFVLSSANALTLQSAGAGDITLSASESGNIKFLIGGVEIGRFSNSGRFGVGTDTPDVKLEVQDSIEQFRISYGTNIHTSFTTNYQGKLTIGPTGQEVIISGGLGIGVSNPTYTLEVGGDIKTADGSRLLLGESDADPSGINGALYYNTVSDKFKCYENGSWTNCISGGSITGSGTANYLPLWSTTSTFADSLIYQTASRIGIGTTAPQAKLDVVGGQTQLEISTQYNQRLCHSGADNSSTQSVLIGDCPSGGADIAEYYNDPFGLEPGDIVIPGSGSYTISLSSAPYQASVIGVVSTNPSGEILGLTTTSPSLRKPVALSGRVPVKISLENGSIKTGDLLTTSSVPGVAMKASEEGSVIGISLEDYDGSTRISNNVSVEEQEQGVFHSSPDKWPLSVGKIMMVVRPSWHDPSIFLSDTGELQNSPIIDTNEEYVYSGFVNRQINETTFDALNTSLSSVQDTIELGLLNSKSEVKRFGNIVVSTTIKTKNILANSIYTGLVKSDQIISRYASLTNAHIHTLTAREITAETSIKAPLIEAKTLIASNEALIGKLRAQEASISGTLTADNVNAKNISSLETNLKDSQSQVSSQSASIQEIQKRISELADKPVDTSEGYYELGDTPLPTSDNLTVLGQTTLFDTTILGTFTAGSLSILDNELLSLTPELKLSALNTINLIDGAVIVDRSGNITARGSVIAKGGVKTDRVEPLDESKTVSLVARDKVNVVDETGREVSSIDASGSAKFSDISVDTFNIASGSGAIIAADRNLRERGIDAPAVDTNATAAGNAILPQGYTNLVIYNSKISDTSLVYVTATSSTQNQSVYVSSKKTCTIENSTTNSDTTIPCVPYFTASIDQPIDRDISFNWWIVK